jgi:predicted dehydrogenase
MIGCGDVAQIVHLPTLGFLSEFFEVTYLCDVSRQAVAHSASKVPSSSSVKTTVSAEDVCSSSDVDVVFIVNSDEFHAVHTVLALKHDKFVFLEKPMALCMRDADAIIEAESKSKGKVMIGYQRRYASAFQEAVKEIGGLGEIKYAKVRDIIGRNEYFIDQSGTFPKKFSDYDPKDSEELKSRADDIAQTALAKECGINVNPETTRMWRYFGR